MIPYSYNMVDMGGIDLAEANGTVVPGVYEKIVEAMNLCGDLILYNWKFAGISIAPSAYTVLQQSSSVLINGMIQVTEFDQITVIGLPPPLVPVSPLTVTENGLYEAELPYSGFNPVTVDVEGFSILSGSIEPTSDLGNDGDIYLLYSPAGIKNIVYGQCIDTGYAANTNSRLVCDFRVTEAQTSEFPTVFGGRPNVGNTVNAVSYHLSKNSRDYSGARVAWQNEALINGIGATPLLGKRARAELKNGLFTLEAEGINVEQTLSQVSIASSTSMFLFQMGVNGNPSTFGQTKGIILYRFSVYENDVLIHDFVPEKDSNDVVCLHDIVTDEYKYPNTGAMEYIESGTIVDAYCKVNGEWQHLIGSNINDVSNI